MKTRIALLTIVCLMLAVAPAMATDTVFYTNGPPNFTTDAWTINFGFAVTDSYPNGFSSGTDLSNLSIGVWQFPGDALLSVQLDNGTSSFGNQLGTAVLTNPTFDDQGTNQYGYSVGVYTFNFSEGLVGECPPGPGNCWITLSNAVVSNGDPIYWDENNGVGGQGPSLAFENSVGSIPSEAFTLSGSPSSTTPEPSSIMLFGSGILGLAGILRRKLTR